MMSHQIRRCIAIIRLTPYANWITLIVRAERSAKQEDEMKLSALLLAACLTSTAAGAATIQFQFTGTVDQVEGPAQSEFSVGEAVTATFSVDDTGKTKRLAHTSRVELRACDVRGRVRDGAPTYRGEAANHPACGREKPCCS